jgi:hypothetical protein
MNSWPSGSDIGFIPWFFSPPVSVGLNPARTDLFLFSRTSNFSAFWRLSPLPVTWLQISF